MVTYSNGKEISRSTLIVIGFALLMGAYFYVLEWILAPLDRWLWSR